ncbi:MAG: 2Fe-2S iron-sulfur cluster binding domain-containing protein, partial [Fretibacterium sp.]|nr:2Fe-2S iron-sulfur cluster binding domain-containing protein [Fretibacterium sp.]
MSDRLFTIQVNGREVRTAEKKKLIRFLRDDLGYTSVKDGCSEGACGTCTVLMDGRPVRSCIMTTEQADGKEVLTVEGLSDFEKEAYVYAFGKAGAVQCGFCTPGMVMASKALLDTNKNPTEEDVKKAIRGNICRCTGYKKILEAVLLVSAILRGDEKIDAGLERSDDFTVGTHTFRDDVRKKVLGTGLYPDDITMENMAHASAVRSAYPRARVLSIDASAAKALPGVLA